MKWLYGIAIACCLSNAVRAGELDDRSEINVIVESLYNVFYGVDGVIRGASPCFFCLGPDDMARSFLSKELQGALGSTTVQRNTLARCVGYDPLVNAKDYAISDFRYNQKMIGVERAQVNVQFSNFEEPQSVILQLDKTPEGWLVSDIGNFREVLRRCTHP